ncbi:MAG: TonB-dependent receptor [Bacteroidetes bacterium]|nr:TonB-dependent receptor [Bacteroidota bacterium]
MQKPSLFLFIIISILTNSAFAQNDTTQQIEYPPISTIPPIIVIATKSTFDNSATSHTVINEQEIISAQISNLSDITRIAPNFYMPDYGSKGTASVFVRGVGARMNEPSIGVYVDGIPYLDKHSFNFDFYDINSIVLLRGPQSTLFGRNSIGGVVQISTLSPFAFEGTKLSISYGNRNAYRYSAAHYTQLSDNFGVSFAVNTSGDDGFFRNEFLGTYDSQKTRGVRAKIDWRLPQNWTVQANVLFDQTLQNAFPYAYFDKELQRPTTIAYNHQGIYNRDVLNSGLLLSKKMKKTQFTSATSYQHLNDSIQMDQDYTIDSLFRLNQTQCQNSITQEFTWRSTSNKPYSWIVGAFGFVKSNDINSLMTMEQGMMNTIQGHMNAAMDEARKEKPKTPFVDLGSQIDIPGRFKMNNYGAAVYHQSELKFLEKFTATAGVRLDVEQTAIDYNSQAILNTTVTGEIFPVPFHSKIVLSAFGKEHETFVNITPKFSLKYDISNNAYVYATVAQGKKSGGYNYSMLSSVFQKTLNEMRSHVKSDTLEIAEDMLYYKPESLWNFEVGSHFSLFENKLRVAVAAYYIHYSDMQIVSTLATNNGSRMIVNAGRSTNYGTEFSARWVVTHNLIFNAQHGYTRATFDNFVFDGNDYSGNYVPFVPRNTLSAGVDYTIDINKRLLENIVVAAQYSYYTNIYFTERNNVQEKFYDIVNATLTFKTKIFDYGVWVKNAFNRKYMVFYCESMGNGFAQQGKPLQFGGALSAKF